MSLRHLQEEDARPETIFELIHPLWLSANIPFLKDLDFLENRLATLGKGKSSASAPADPKRDQRSRRKVGGRRIQRQKKPCEIAGSCA